MGSRCEPWQFRVRIDAIATFQTDARVLGIVGVPFLSSKVHFEPPVYPCRENVKAAIVEEDLVLGWRGRRWRGGARLSRGESRDRGLEQWHHVFPVDHLWPRVPGGCVRVNSCLASVAVFLLFSPLLSSPLLPSPPLSSLFHLVPLWAETLTYPGGSALSAPATATLVAKISSDVTIVEIEPPATDSGITRL